MGRLIIMSAGGYTLEPESCLIDEHFVGSIGKRTPKICLLPTACGDRQETIDRFHLYFQGHGAITSVVSLFMPEIEDIECSYEEMDVIARQVSRILNPGGKFCLEMQDGLERFRGSKGMEDAFDVITGTRQSIVNVSNEGEFSYDVTFWTVGFARFVVSRYLHFAGMEQGDRLYVLLFEKLTASVEDRR